MKSFSAWGLSPVLRIFLFVIFVSAGNAADLDGDHRYALVIGNGAYVGWPALKNPINDSADMAKALEALNFSVELLQNANRKELHQAVVRFRERLEADPQSLGFVYFAGHGIQADGTNYLVPVGASIESDADLEDEALSIQGIFDSLQAAHNKMNVIILDACRNNPLPGMTRGAMRGLTIVSAAPPESIVLFSTGANQVAQDGVGRNSPFAEALLNHLGDSCDISLMIKAVTSDVKAATGGFQVPYQYSSLDFNLSLSPGWNGEEIPGNPAVPRKRLTADTWTWDFRPGVEFPILSSSQWFQWGGFGSAELSVTNDKNPFYWAGKLCYSLDVSSHNPDSVSTTSFQLGFGGKWDPGIGLDFLAQLDAGYFYCFLNDLSSSGGNPCVGADLGVELAAGEFRWALGTSLVDNFGFYTGCQLWTEIYFSIP